MCNLPDTNTCIEIARVTNNAREFRRVEGLRLEDWTE